MQNPNKYVLPKILIGIPTYDAKNYCLDAFFQNISEFTYPKSNIEIFVADNSSTNKNALMIRDKFKVKTFWKDYTGVPIMEKLADSHNQVRRYFLESDADYLLHLESDIFPPKDVIEQLLWARKPIVTSMYQIFDGAWRTPCIRIQDKKTLHYNDIVFDYELNNFHHYWTDGTIKEIFIAGIGCTLMNRKIMKNIQFRHDTTTKEGSPPDTYFAMDLRDKKVKNWIHTGVISFHWNKEDWGRHFNYINYHKSE
jgi:cellulose synthase/poly-beta-1,6-N-acetylglucosamine synthase-like glycosyltransferase